MLHQTGSEFVFKTQFRQDELTRPVTLEIGLYNDSQDALVKSDDISAITTEPTGSAYSPISVDFDTADISVASEQSTWQSEVSELSFNVNDSTVSVDSYYVAVKFLSEEASDSSESTHLFWTERLDSSYDLSDITELNAEGIGLIDGT